MRTSPLAWLVLAGILFLTPLAPGQDRVVSPLMCGANQGFEVLAVHDLVSQNFGILHFNAISYGPPDMTTWDPSRGYEAMPAGDACSLFGKLIGGTIVSRGSTAHRLVVRREDARLIFAVNDSVHPKTVHWPREVVGAKTAQYEAVTMTPKAGQGEDPLRADRVERHLTQGSMAADGFHWSLPPYSISYVRCF